MARLRGTVRVRGTAGQIGRQDDTGPVGHREAARRGDDGGFHVGDGQHHLLHAGHPAAVFAMGLPGVFRKIDPGAEGAAGAGNDDRPHVGIVVQGQKGLVEFPGQRRAEGVHLLGAIEGDGADILGGFDQDGMVAHGGASKGRAVNAPARG